MYIVKETSEEDPRSASRNPPADSLNSVYDCKDEPKFHGHSEG